MPHDRFYGIAAEEIARHEVDKDLMARAYAMALGDADKTKAIYIGIRAERLEQLACELVEERQKAEEERRQEEQRDARAAAEARAREARKQERDREDEKRRIDAAAAAARREAAKPKEKPLPNPEDFTDPKMADAVRAMREALRVGGSRK